jgi:hypothetical protein
MPRTFFRLSKTCYTPLRVPAPRTAVLSPSRWGGRPQLPFIISPAACRCNHKPLLEFPEGRSSLPFVGWGPRLTGTGAPVDGPPGKPGRRLTVVRSQGVTRFVPAADTVEEDPPAVTPRIAEGGCVPRGILSDIVKITYIKRVYKPLGSLASSPSVCSGAFFCLQIGL